MSEPNNYELLADDDITPVTFIGLKDNNRNGIPDLAYVTGTGAFDRITLTRDATNTNLVHVVSTPYSDAGFSIPIQAAASYSINLLAQTEGPILIESSHSNDLIEIDSNIAASFKIRGMAGDDHVKLIGKGPTAIRSFVFDGEAGNDTFTIDFKTNNVDPLPLLGFDFNFIGGAGTDNANVIEPTAMGGATRTAYFVNMFTDATSGSLTGDQMTLRSAVQTANALNNNYIFLPAGTYNLTLGGAGGDTQGDLDIGKSMTIIGTGAGSTVINAAGLSIRDRVFEVTGGTDIAFKLSRVTLTGGQTASGGGAIMVNNSSTSSVTELWLTESAIVGNTATGSGHGGAIYVQPGVMTYLTCNVITGNTAGGSGGGIYASGANGAITYGSVALDRNIVANNSASTGVNLFSAAATGGGSGSGMFGSGGGNLFSSTIGSNLPSTSSGTDHVGSVDYIVTSTVDTFAATSNAATLSLREAIRDANPLSTAKTIWIPGWGLVLTRGRNGAATDADIAYGDLDITNSLNIRGSGISNATSVKWRHGIADAVFDLIGDFNGNGTTVFDNNQVDGNDFQIWQQTNGSMSDLRADANEDGVVDGADYTLWSQNNGNILSKFNVLEG